MSDIPTDNNNVPGDPRTAKSRVLEGGASMVQDFTPTQQICAHLNAFHARPFPHLRQCLLYDSTKPNARLLGVEYMVTPRLFQTLPPEERKLWHTHEYEVKSGMLIMPAPALVPDAAWDAAETAEMRDIIPLYGKTYHFWQVDRGDQVPLGPPQLMGSFTSDERVRMAHPGGLDGLCQERNERFGTDHRVKAEKRRDIESPETHPDADAMWK
ncbi:hypothetical protein HFD88_007595 [Aspergillus terreus]|nr:hypothetical protein HFD88_007595 [Aspergillus terreus]